MINKNDEFILDITEFSGEGNGIGHHNNMVVFVNGAIKGDTVLCHIIKSKKNYCIGIIKAFVNKSSLRIESDCEISNKCGGCIYKNIPYKEELKIKSNEVYQCIKRIGKYDILPQNIIYGKRNNYRNKASLPVTQNYTFGFYANKTHKIIENKNLSCNISSNIFNKILKDISLFLKNNNISVYNEETNNGLLKHVVLRYAQKTNQIMVIFAVKNNRFENLKNIADFITNKHKEIKSIYINVNSQKTNVILGEKNIKIFGEDFITDELCNLKFNISPLSFYQVNRDMAEKLYFKVKEYADVLNKTVLDLYCGTGTIGLSLAKEAKKVYGIEIVNQAIENAKQNAKLNNITNAEFFCDDAVNIDKYITEQIDTVILDPPRKGTDKKITDYIAAVIKPSVIVYVSCDSATLARDLTYFKENNYILKEYTPVDMFPCTKHVETVAKLEIMV